MQFLYFCNCHPTFFIALLFSVSFFQYFTISSPLQKNHKCISQAPTQRFEDVDPFHTRDHTWPSISSLFLSLSRLSLSYYIIILYLLFRKMVLKYHLDFKTVISISFDSTKHTHIRFEKLLNTELRDQDLLFLLKT